MKNKIIELNSDCLFEKKSGWIIRYGMLILVLYIFLLLIVAKLIIIPQRYEGVGTLQSSNSIMVKQDKIIDTSNNAIKKGKIKIMLRNPISSVQMAIYKIVKVESNKYIIYFFAEDRLFNPLIKDVECNYQLIVNDKSLLNVIFLSLKTSVSEAK